MIEIKVLASSSSANSTVVDDGHTRLLLDAGLTFKVLRQKLNFQLSSISGGLITHGHNDHCRAARDLIKSGIDCYMSEGTWAELGGPTGHRVKIIKAKIPFKIGTWTIMPFDVQHDCAEPLGFLLASGKYKILYLTDSFYSKFLFSGLTHILIEANYALDILNANIEAGITPAELKSRLLKSHMSLETCKNFLLANDLSLLQEIHLIHLSGDNSHAERFKNEVAAIVGVPVYVADG